MIRITDKKNRERLLIFLYFFYLCPNTKNTHKIMKKLFILFTLLLQLLSPIYPQQAATVITPSLKYGKPSKEELLFTTYTPDTTATALYLFHQGQSNFTYHDGFQLITEHWIRIKILKPQGTAYADVSVPFYAPTDKEEGEERASEVEGITWKTGNV
jgi:hypothetical protein